MEILLEGAVYGNGLLTVRPLGPGQWGGLMVMNNEWPLLMPECFQRAEQVFHLETFISSLTMTVFWAVYLLKV